MKIREKKLTIKNQWTDVEQQIQKNAKRSIKFYEAEFKVGKLLNRRRYDIMVLRKFKKE